jgi:hypothetical protein
MLAVLTSAAYAQIETDDETSFRDPDVVAAEEIVRELREAAEADRQDQIAAPREQVDALIAGIEVETSVPDREVCKNAY